MFFNIQIGRLADRFLMEIQENVNPGAETRQLSKIPFEYRKNMQSQIVVCHSRDRHSACDSAGEKRTQYSVC